MTSARPCYNTPMPSERDNMAKDDTRNPTPIIGEHNRKICPVCGKRSYSAGGIHPQCAVQQAEAPREQQHKAKAKKKPVAKKPPQKKWLRRGQFVAIGKGGRQVTIIYQVKMEDVANTREGTRFRTATGDLPVTRVAKGKYRLPNKEILRTDDPGEPDLP